MEVVKLATDWNMKEGKGTISSIELYSLLQTEIAYSSLACYKLIMKEGKGQEVA